MQWAEVQMEEVQDLPGNQGRGTPLSDDNPTNHYSPQWTLQYRSSQYTEEAVLGQKGEKVTRKYINEL